MTSRALRPANAALYEEDFALWSAETARLLREGRFEEIDIEHLVEEVEGMAKSDRRELNSRMTVLLIHLLKWKFQPAKRSGSWENTIAVQRGKLEQLFLDSPSLRTDATDSARTVYRHAVRLAGIQTRLGPKAFPAECPFTPEQILNEDFLPE